MHVCYLLLQAVVRPTRWTSFGYEWEKGREMGTDPGDRDGGRVRKAVARGKQGGGGGSSQGCCMRAVRGHAYVRTERPGSTCGMQLVCDGYVPLWNGGLRDLCGCVWEGGRPRYCRRDDALERVGWKEVEVGGSWEKSVKQLGPAGLAGESGGVGKLGEG